MAQRPVTLQTQQLRRVRFSLRFKLLVGLIFIIGIIFLAVNVFNILANQRARRIEALNNSETIARLVVGAILDELGQGTPLSSPKIKRMVGTFLLPGLVQNKKNRDLAYAVVLDETGTLVAGRARAQLTLLDGKSLKTEAAALEAIAKRKGRLGYPMKAKAFPLKLSHDAPPIGRVLVGTSLARLDHQTRQDLYVNIAVLLGALFILVVYTYFFLAYLVITPLDTIARAMRDMQSGNLDTKVSIDRNDEIGVLADNYNYMVAGVREQLRLKDAFSRYVSDQVYQRFKEGAVSLSGETKRATILFSDIRSFTTLSEQLSPEEVVAMLNTYFSRMVDIVFKYDGFLNKFMGDALMALYNVPVDQDEPEMRAVRTGVEMLEALAVLNEQRESRGLFPIRIGIGINTGDVVAGNIGHQQRLEYTVIGDAVNLAQRIESQTKVAGAQLLISESTYSKVVGQVVAETLPPVKVKGKAEPVPLFAVRGLRALDVTSGTTTAGTIQPNPLQNR